MSHRHRGFTLVELLLVVVLISVMAGAVIVSFQGRHEIYVLQTSAKDLAAAIEFSASQARIMQTPYRIAFDPLRSHYQIESFNDDAFLPAEGIAGLKKGLGKGIQILQAPKPEETSTSLPDSLDFNPNGSGFTGTIELRHASINKIARIQVMPNTLQTTITFGEQNALP